ncbi:hypothetical protein AKJ16_DCAP21265 [Drosera capensis]
MPQELTGFYYDAEKNRYLAISGPFSGSVPLVVFCAFCMVGEELIKEGHQKRKTRSGLRTAWKYDEHQKSEGFGFILAQLRMLQQHLAHANVETPMGEFGIELLLTGGVDDTLGLFEVGKVGLHSQAVHWRHIQPGSIVGYGCTVAFSHIRQAT